MRKGVFVLLVVNLLLGMQFGLMSYRWKQMNNAIHRANMHAQKNLGRWSSAKVASADVANREQANLNSLKLPILVATSPNAFYMQGGERMGDEKRFGISRAIPQGAKANSIEVRTGTKYVFNKICDLVRRIRSNRGNLINSPTCSYLPNRNAQRAKNQASAMGRGVSFLSATGGRNGGAKNSPLSRNSPLSPKESKRREEELRSQRNVRSKNAVGTPMLTKNESDIASAQREERNVRLKSQKTNQERTKDSKIETRSARARDHADEELIK